jgi:hypothetical protein
MPILHKTSWCAGTVFLVFLGCGGNDATSTGTGSSSGAGGAASSTTAATSTGANGTSGTGSGGGCSAPSECLSGLCQGGLCKDNLSGAFAWPGSQYDQQIARLTDGTFFSAGGFPQVNGMPLGLTVSQVTADGASVLATVDRGLSTTSQSAFVPRVIPLGADVLVLDVHAGDALDIGGGITIPKIGVGVFFATRLGVDGNAKWATVIQGPGATDAYHFVADAAVDDAGQVWLLVNPSLGSPYTVNGTAIAFHQGYPEILKLDPATGQLLGHRPVAAFAAGCSVSDFPDSGNKVPPNSTIVGTADGVVVAGEASEQCDFGGGPIPMPSALTTWGYVARFDGNLAHVWSRALTAGTAPNYTSGFEGLTLARSGGALYVAGEFTQNIDLGMGLLTGNVAVAGLDLATGATLFSKAFSGTAKYHTKVLALAASPGGVAIGGVTDAGEDFGVTPLGLGSGGFLLKMDPSGSPLWAGTFAGVDRILGVAPTGQQRVALITHGTNVDLGNGPIADAPSKLAVGLFQLPGQ